MVNVLLLVPIVFSNAPEHYGFVQTILSYAIIFSQFFSLGAPNIAIRFFKSFDDRGAAKSLFTISLIFPLIGMMVIGLAMWLGEPMFHYLVEEKEVPLLQSNLYVLFLLTLIQTYFNAVQGISQALLKTMLPQFLTEVFLRVGTLVLFLAYYYFDIGFDGLVAGYLMLYAVNFMILIMTLYKYLFPLSFKGWGSLKEIMRFGAFSILDKSAYVLVNRMDMIMIAALIGLSDVTYYTFAMFIGSVVAIPQKALSSISTPIIAKAWGNDDREELNTVYYKSANAQLFVGGLILLLIATNLEQLFMMIEDKFAAGFYVVIFIGLSKLAYLASGVSGAIIFYSKNYTVNFYFNLILIVLSALTNWLLIPHYGIVGAAMATLLSLIAFNAFKIIYVYRKWNLFPFDGKTIGIVVLLAIVYLANHFFYLKVGNPILNIVVNGALAGGVVLAAAFALKLVEDMNVQVHKILRALKR